MSRDHKPVCIRILISTSRLFITALQICRAEQKLEKNKKFKYHEIIITKPIIRKVIVWPKCAVKLEKKSLN
jgi:hypothetical protein